jgi:hypothetical protein
MTELTFMDGLWFKLGALASDFMLGLAQAALLLIVGMFIINKYGGKKNND